MKSHRSFAHLYAAFLLYALLAGGCNSLFAPPTPTSTPTPLPTATPTITPTVTPTLKPTSSPSPTRSASSTRASTITKGPTPTSPPKTQVPVTTEGLQIDFDLPLCGLISMTLSGKTYKPISPDTGLCLLFGDLRTGTATQTLINQWVTGGACWLVSHEGNQGRIMGASVNQENGKVMMVFSVPSTFSTPLSLHLTDQTVTFP